MRTFRWLSYANESLHPTAWVGQFAVDFIRDRAPYIVNGTLKDAPWFLKVSMENIHLFLHPKPIYLMIQTFDLHIYISSFVSLELFLKKNPRHFSHLIFSLPGGYFVSNLLSIV